MATTIGQISAVIAAVIFILQFLLPNAVTLILVGILRQTHSAVTWSVVQRNLFSSHWPLLTNSDATANRGVDTKVRFITLLKPIGLVLISLAAVITPLGLHDNVLPSADTGTVVFGHLPDTGPFGYSSMSRGGLRFTRMCSEISVLLPCPGTKTEIDFTYNKFNEITNGTLAPGTTYDVDVPQSLIDLYQSGLSNQPDSVASFFDIESRLFTYKNDSDVANGEKYIVDTFKMLQSIILDDTIRPIEGLIADVKNGGIGFRNHSVPQNIDLGAEWTEDILFIEPETECVNLNVTYEFTIGPLGSDAYNNENLVLVDEGGFVNINHTYPEVDMSDPQKHANLRERAYKAAWMTNVWTMLYMNVTRPNPKSFAYLNSTMGRRFPLTSYMTEGGNANSITTTSLFSNLLEPEAKASNTSIFDFSSPFSNSSTNQPLYSNPFDITMSNFTSIGTICQGAGGQDYTNATNIHVACGLIFGAARPVDDTTIPIVPVPYTRWRQPVYACASSAKASIKEVSFHFNTSMTRDINSLTILNVTDKVYSDEESMPRWGVETVDYTLVQLNQLWGLISEANANAPNLTSFKAPFMRLPGFQGAITTLAGFEYIPGNQGPGHALESIYDPSSTVYDWTGATSIAMMQRWRQLANSTQGAAHIANLIWTDLAANKMTTGRNWNQKTVRWEKRSDSDESSGKKSPAYGTVPVIKFERRIQYKWPYAIPAFIVLAMTVVVGVVSIILSIVKHAGIHHVRYYTDSLSSGRLLAAAQYPGSVDKLAPTKVWLNSAGRFLTSLAPMSRGKYQQLHQPSPTQYSQYPANPQSNSALYGSNTTLIHPTAYTSTGYQQVPVSNTSYTGANMPWSEKGHPSARATEEIPLTPIGSDYQINRGGYMRVSNA